MRDLTIRGIAARLTFRKVLPRVSVVRLAGIIGPRLPMRAGLNLAPDARFGMITWDEWLKARYGPPA